MSARGNLTRQQCPENVRILLANFFGASETIGCPFAGDPMRLKRRDAIAGVNRTTIANVVAEIGVDMSVSLDEHHLSSWAGICPGNEESAGYEIAPAPGFDAEPACGLIAAPEEAFKANASWRMPG